MQARPWRGCHARQAGRLGSLRARAWGVSRAFDYFETDTSVDARNVGRTATQATAKPPSLRTSRASGSRNQLIRRGRRRGELVENVAATSKYQWMTGNLLEYAGSLNWNDRPVDAHELVAVCAPRPVFIIRRVDPERRVKA